MNGCTGDCNQGRLPCNCKSIRLDYGKRDRLIFLERERHYHKWDRYLKWLLIIAVMYFGFHIYNALAETPVIINTPDGGQRVCIVQGGFVTCY